MARYRNPKLGFFKMENFHSLKANIKNKNREGTDWEKISVNVIFANRLASSIQLESCKPISPI